MYFKVRVKKYPVRLRDERNLIHALFPGEDLDVLLLKIIELFKTLLRFLGKGISNVDLVILPQS